MRTAICFSGLLRDYPRYLPRFAEFASQWKANVFIHSWRIEPDGKKVTQEDENIIGAALNPVAIDIEDPAKLKEEFDSFDKWNAKKEDPWSQPAQNFASMFYSIFECDAMRRMWERAHGFKYDVVFRQRFDQIFDQPLTIEDLDLEKINVVKINRNDGVADLWAAGNSKNMSIYGNIANHLNEAFDAIKFVRPEDMLKWWLDKNNLQTHIVDKPYSIK